MKYARIGADDWYPRTPEQAKNWNKEWPKKVVPDLPASGKSQLPEGFGFLDSVGADTSSLVTRTTRGNMYDHIDWTLGTVREYGYKWMTWIGMGTLAILYGMWILAVPAYFYAMYCWGRRKVWKERLVVRWNKPVINGRSSPVKTNLKILGGLPELT